MMTLKLLQLPVPLLAVFMLPQVPDLATTVLPAWITAFLVGVWVTVSILEKLGRLPGANKDRREHAFTNEDRKMLEGVHASATREDPDKPGWMLSWSASAAEKDIRQRLDEAVDVLERVADQQEVLIRLLAKKNGGA